MNEVWVVSVSTSLPGVRFYEALKNRMYAFDSFAKAREGLRKLLRELAFSNNAMFDGQGNMTYMKRYMEEVEEYYKDDDEEDVEEGFLGKTVAKNLLSGFSHIFSGEDTDLDIAPGIYGDWMIQVTVENDSVAFEGVDDGPINGYTPLANTNMFSMQEEKDYYLYIDDAFGFSDNDASSELYIDLKKVTVE